MMGSMAEVYDRSEYTVTTLLLFGPQVLSFNKEALDKLRDGLSKDGPTQNQWVLDTVAGLPEYWKALINKIPEIGDAVPGQTLLMDLDSWLRKGVKNDTTRNMPNMVLIPLVVLTHLKQYWRYLELHQAQKENATDFQMELVRKANTTNKKFETLGFCTGLLSAFAVASANNGAELEQYSAVAIRLAMIIGALVDAQEACSKNDKFDVDGPSKSYATAWRTLEQREEMERIIGDVYPKAYVSVLCDEARATVTISESIAPQVVRYIRAAGITASEIGIRGRFHSPGVAMSGHVDNLIAICNDNPRLQFTNANKLALPSYVNNKGKSSDFSISSTAGGLHEIALRSILIQKCDWYDAFTEVRTDRLDSEGSLVISFGPERCIPPSIMRCLGPRAVHLADTDEDVPQFWAQSVPSPSAEEKTSTNSRDILFEDEGIAVVGMSIKVAGADDLDEFSKMLRTGESQHEWIDPTTDRLMCDTLFRESDKDPKRKWYGNFVRDIDAFDHKFFKRSPRESATMDPQQRLFLQAAYQAVEQSGYFTEPTTFSSKEKRHVGVYVGACADDYAHHVACHPANAFTATGNLRSFIPGKVSHHFGWTGPSMTLDTACSGSAVAIHTACRNLLSGECTSALAGGVATMSNFLFFQNLASASFLSPTGQCKPFDENADGYCRAEGIACVFLKRMSDAIADGNQIFGCIASTAVYQNQNCTPLFVPNTPSLSQLFIDVIQKAKLKPTDISLVEAHGTGTPVGDPVEYESIRAVWAGARTKPLPIGSVKGHIGHAEGASGVISLIKIIVMMQDKFIPPQASFSKMSRHIDVKPSDMIEVVTVLRQWRDPFKAALINNYGASGTNASMIVTQAPRKYDGLIRVIKDTEHHEPLLFPFWIPGLDAGSIGLYSSRLLSYLQSHPNDAVSLADISFNLSRQTNPFLSQAMIFSCRSVIELCEKLSGAKLKAMSSPTEAGIAPVKLERPIILCFGGQVSQFVGLDPKVYNSISVFRHHLDKCNTIIQSLGLRSIYPGIFSRAPIQDTIELQTMLLAMQYSCAKSWMDCGLSTKVVAVVGHSFGEITALCIAGVLSIEDTVKLVSGRAKLVRDKWGTDPGLMMAVEAEEAIIHNLLRKSNHAFGGDQPASIACYNGPCSFTLAGPIKAIESVCETIRRDTQFSSVKSKMLNVTNAFHCSLVEPLEDELRRVGEDITFNKPIIPFERVAKIKSTEKLTSKFVHEHMRQPVYFNHALQRLAKQYPSAIFLEAGSNSTVTIMASRALAASMLSGAHHFQALSITNTEKGVHGLADATVSMWKQGVHVSFWPHHTIQTYDYATMLLPPYQFEKARHWLELKSPLKAVAEAAALAKSNSGVSAQSQQAEKSLGLWSFIEYRSEGKTGQTHPRFRINTESSKYKNFISGHLISQTAPICPATLEVDMAIEALFSLHPSWSDSGFNPVLLDMVNHAPICVDPSRTVFLDFTALDNDKGPNHALWGWKIVSTSIETTVHDMQIHVEAKLHVRSTSDVAYQTEFARFERFVDYEQCSSLLALSGDQDLDVDILQGRHIYNNFGEIVNYSELYRGVRRIVGRVDILQCAGVVHKRHAGETWLDVHLSDCFSQVGGIWINCMTDRNPTDMYIAVACEISMRSPLVTIDNNEKARPDVWHVLARHHRKSEKTYMTDVFVFNAANGQLAEVMLGIQYARVAKASMRKILTRLTTDISVLENQVPHSLIPPIVSSASDIPAPSSGIVRSVGVVASEDVKKLVANVTGVELDDIELDSELADFGIDSLMGMEISREVENVFKCTLDQYELMEAATLRKLVTCISNALYGPDPGDNTVEGVGEEDQTKQYNNNGNEFLQREEKIEKIATLDPSPTPITSNLRLDQLEILECFGQVKMLSDERIRQFHLDNIEQVVIAATNRLCAALVVEAFHMLGCNLRGANPGELLPRVLFQPQHARLMESLYAFLENDARLVTIDVASSEMKRTWIATPSKSSEAILHELLALYPEFIVANKLTYYAGKHLAGVLSGETDGIRVIFGSLEGRQLVEALYCEHTFNRMNYGQMRDTIGHLIQCVRTRQPGETLKILEMGAGTGGTTHILAPFLASLDVPVEYTFTDLSPSMISNARRKFGKQYSFMRFAVHDIEKPPADDICGNHIILASNAIHATHNLEESLSNMHKALRPDGFLMMLEMTESVPFIDLIFGLLEGWWLFDDGRSHAIVSVEHWERSLHAASFGHVDWTDGNLYENNFQRVIIALASGCIQERLPKPSTTQEEPSRNLSMIEDECERYVTKFSNGWEMTDLVAGQIRNTHTLPAKNAVVLVTGATGSLGSHLASVLAEHPTVMTVVCLNRRSSTLANTRQTEAFRSRGIELPLNISTKVRVIEADTSKLKLGLPETEWAWLVQNGTHIIHNAWPMSGTRPVKAFEPQFQAVRNLLNLAKEMAYRYDAPRISFQLVSSIGVIGQADEDRVKEHRVPFSATLPVGYCEAKWVCERLLDETLHRHPNLFRTMVVRPGQISGSTTSGFWNPVEHFAFLIKSAQALHAFPDFDGILQWVPVDICARSMVDLLAIGDLAAPQAHPVYHLDNPVGQPWREMSRVLADAMDIPPGRIIPFKDWVRLVRRAPLHVETENPAMRLIDFLEQSFERMSCGGVILDTTMAKKHSKSMALLGPVSNQVARQYVTAWKEMGFLFL